MLQLTKPLAFIDLETTGVNLGTDRIIEIAIVKVLTDGNRSVKRKLINPGISIPKASSDVHGITDEMVKEAPFFKQVAQELKQFLDGCDLAGYNSNRFDIPLLVEEFLRANVDIPFLADKKIIDALKIFHQMEKRDLTSAYKFYCGKELNNAHSADIDTIATVEVLHDQIRKYQLSSSLNVLHNLCNEECETLDYEGKFVRNDDGVIVFTFGQHKGEAVSDHIDYLQWMMRQNFANYTKLIIRKIINGELDNLPY